MDLIIGGGDGGNGGLGSENGPILYNEPNRTSAIDDIRSVVIYIFIITIFVSFFLILPGIRNEKFPTFLCITTSLIVTSILIVSLFGTTWHIGEAPISAAYKAFSRDRIQGELSVRIGLKSVNITLLAHKYYILHAVHGPMIMDNTPLLSESHKQDSQTSSFGDNPTSSSASASSFIDLVNNEPSESTPVSSDVNDARNLGDELLSGRTSDGSLVDTELEVEEVFPSSSSEPEQQAQASRRRTRSSSNATNAQTQDNIKLNSDEGSQIKKRSTTIKKETTAQQVSSREKFTIKRVNVDINYNERFYWIEPDQMREEHHSALKRGLPFPILTVVEYLSQDEAGFSWSRQYRLAGYYSNIIIWLALCVCALMFFLHCAAPKYGIYMMQLVGGLMLFTNLTYASLVPSGKHKLVIPFEGQSLTFQFGWNFWLVFIGGCLSLIVGSIIVIIDCIYPNFIFTTILDVDFDSHNKYSYKQRQKIANKQQPKALERPIKPPFLENSTTGIRNESRSQGFRTQESSSLNDSHHDIQTSSSSGNSHSFSSNSDSSNDLIGVQNGGNLRTRQHLKGKNRANNFSRSSNEKRKGVSYLNELFLEPAQVKADMRRSDSEVKMSPNEGDNDSRISSSVFKMVRDDSAASIGTETTPMVSDTCQNMEDRDQQSTPTMPPVKSKSVNSQDHYISASKQIDNKNLKNTDHQLARRAANRDDRTTSGDSVTVRL